ncbi:thiopurine S-methyltransferase [Loktanella ponticola]|uniref:thiopurine S-methyltransferase n=1 Tax=Yoonia ponticola TaxID=1524255 RepID=A0A7W9EWT4_9RHOB|nr:thiopurine S-methyltransferase [Yoonia ponticola]
MQRHFLALNLAADARVFVPLCGKSRDIAWLLARGCRVVGIELSEIAVQQLFDEMAVVPVVSQIGPLTLYAADGVDIYVGDVFALTAKVLGQVDAVFDRAALVALPAELRSRYAAHLVAITDSATQLVVTFTYDQTQMSGPPFSISERMIKDLYAGSYDLHDLQTQDVPGGFKGKIPATETAWFLQAAS